MHPATGRGRGKAVKVYSAKGRRRHRTKVKPRRGVYRTQIYEQERRQSGGRAASKRQGLRETVPPWVGLVR